MGGFASHTKPVDAAIVREVGRDFDFGVGAVAAQPPFSRHAAAAAARSSSQPPVVAVAAPISDDTANIGAIDRGLGDGRTPSAVDAAAARKKRFLFF